MSSEATAELTNLVHEWLRIDQVRGDNVLTAWGVLKVNVWGTFAHPGPHRASVAGRYLRLREVRKGLICEDRVTLFEGGSTPVHSRPLFLPFRVTRRSESVLFLLLASLPTVSGSGSDTVSGPGSDTVSGPGSDTVSGPGSDALSGPGSDALSGPGSDALSGPGSDALSGPGSDTV
jgi:hypothetical protein